MVQSSTKAIAIIRGRCAKISLNNIVNEFTMVTRKIPPLLLIT